MINYDINRVEFTDETIIAASRGELEWKGDFCPAVWVSMGETYFGMTDWMNNFIGLPCSQEFYDQFEKEFDKYA